VLYAIKLFRNPKSNPQLPHIQESTEKQTHQDILAILSFDYVKNYWLFVNLSEALPELTLGASSQTRFPSAEP
jgi:hypothetical protein